MTIIDYIEFSFIKGIGLKTSKQIYEQFGSISKIFNNPEILKDNFPSVYKKFIKRNKFLRKKAENEFLKAKKLNIDIISIEDTYYPKLLKEIPDPPLILYVKGDLSLLKNPISIVGSRNYTQYGKLLAEKTASLLAKQNISVVSGMASGIDSIVHQSTLDSNGYTLAVLGNGVDQIFPKENKNLYWKIIDNGSIISEFPLGTPPSKYTFPIRNRIIAGISYGTIIVEASSKSGALITARLSTEYGREVMTFPTNINNKYGKGNNILIKEGASILTEIDDLFEYIPYLNNKITKKEDSTHWLLNELNEPVHIDLLRDQLKMNINELMIILFSLEMEEKITIKDGIVYKKI